MPAGVITGLLSKAAVELGKRGYKKLTAETPVTRAIERTADAFAEFEVRQTLVLWYDGDVFASLLAALKAGDRNLTDLH